MIGKDVKATEKIVEFAHGLEYAQVPQNVIGQLKRSALNILGTSLAGASLAPAYIWFDYARMCESPSGCTVWGSDIRASLPAAVFVNGQTAHLLDFDEGYCGPFMYASHPQTSLIPAALTVGETVGVSGKDFLVACAAGLEVTLRVARAIYPGWENLHNAAVHGKGATQTLGCSIAAGRLLNLSGTELLNAFGFAGETAPLSMHTKWISEIGEKPVSWTRNQIGWAAETGVRSAWFARKGAIGGRSLLDGPAGFFRMVGSPIFDSSVLLQQLGEEWLIATPHHYFKRFPIAGTLLASLDAVDTLVRKHEFKPADVERITIYTDSKLLKFGFGSSVTGNPKYTYDGQYSAPHCVGCIVARKVPGPDWVSKDTLQDANVKAVAAKVHLVADVTAEQEFARDHWYSRVAVQLRDRRTLEHIQPIQRGHELNPFTRSELEEKFNSLAAHSISPSAAQQIMELIDRLESVPDVRAITGLLRGSR